jgi:tetratricopeptide (TPR) repeat protein
MVDVCNAVGLRRQSLPHLMFLVRHDRIRPEYLMYMGNLAKDTSSSERLESSLARYPDDLLPNLGLARLAVSDGEFDRAVGLLSSLIKQRPEMLEAHVQTGIALSESDPQRLAAWNSKLPPSAEEHPDVWYVRGRWLRDQGQEPESVRCFAEAILLDPNHLQSHQALAQLLQRAGDGQRAKAFAEKAEKLQKINIALEQIYKSRMHTPLMRELAELTLDLGRVWECLGWCGYAMSVDRSLGWPGEIAQQATQRFQITGSTPHTLPQFNLVGTVLKSESYPMPEFSDTVQLAENNGPQAAAEAARTVAFRDVALEVGIDFQFDNNSAHPHEGRYIFETTGGGVGIIDYDLDGWSDVFLAQGGSFPPQPGNPAHGDQLYRSIHGDTSTRFRVATDGAKILDSAFGQGVAVGDVNGDGFDDIFVCNIGPNQLWINAGDGTFVDGSGLMAQTDDWTCSAAIADLNLDGLPEIYEANYVTGPDVYTRMCVIGDKPRSCGPLVFSPSADRVLTPDALGNFSPVDLQGSMMGNSLGVVVFKMQDRDLPSVFVAVDQQANLLGNVVIDQASGGEESVSFTLQDEAIVLGLGYDAGGNAQACMGIAAGDANGDGAVDLFVTNFYLEYYTLYLQEDGLFRDATAATGTIPHTKPLLGFGTQLLDAQLDGHQDLFVLNGHIDNHTHIGVPEAMPPQLFLGTGTGKFDLLPPEGNYLGRTVIGRALAKLDFDRDGRVDLLATDLESKASLVRNESTVLGKSISLRLVGTQSDRNAFCTQAALSSSDTRADSPTFRQTQQLTGGSGYQSSNERSLQFSIPDFVFEAANDDFVLEIQWPSGLVEQHRGLEAGGAYTAVEGQGLHQVR